MTSFAKVTPGSDVNAVIDKKKMKRMLSNRESARRSRMKRQKHLEDLVHEKAALENKLIEDNLKYEGMRQGHFSLELENKALRAQKMKLIEYLKFLQQILENYKQNESSLNLQVSESVLNPWQVHGPIQPITASGMFNFSSMM